MARKEYKKYFSSLFASAALLAVGAISLIENGAMDYYSVLGALKKALPAALVLWGLGWILGMIVDTPRRSHQIKYNNAIMEELFKEAQNAQTESKAEASSESSAQEPSQSEEISKG